MHAVGVTHRDVKLENIFMDGSGAVKLGDFDLAVFHHEAQVRGGRMGTIGREGEAEGSKETKGTQTPMKELHRPHSICTATHKACSAVHWHPEPACNVRGCAHDAPC